MPSNLSPTVKTCASPFVALQGEDLHPVRSAAVLWDFEVPVGADILGCSGGTFVDTPLGHVEKAFTCATGPGAGDTFTYLFETASNAFSGGNANGHWIVLAGAGFFATLRGEGDFALQLFDLNGDGVPDHGSLDYAR